MEKKQLFKEEKLNTTSYFEYLEKLEEYYNNSVGTTVEKLYNFPKYAPRQSITNFLSKYEIFKKIQNIQGSIVECGVLFGGGLMSFAHFSSIFEPVNNQRRIIGFDTFSGFGELHPTDKLGASQYMKKGGLAVDSFDELKQCISLYDENRFLNHIPKVELVKGDATKTIPKYIKDNPHLVVSLLHLDFDIYKPTKVALENFIPRMPKGSVIIFDELNSKDFQGETQALIDSLGINNLKIERFSFDSVISYAVLD